MSTSWLYSFSTRELKTYTVISLEKTIHEALPLQSNQLGGISSGFYSKN